MNTDAVVIDTIRELAANEEQQVAMFIRAGAALMQGNVVILAELAANEAKPFSVRRR
jgi:hypothetical protein